MEPKKRMRMNLRNPKVVRVTLAAWKARRAIVEVALRRYIALAAAELEGLKVC
jgi:hypothetical protein